ncbi:MAG: tRNA-dihydrouridine synthase [Minisyncoccia bacterium]|jgi:nifR3 family TIM-barrel protein
MATGFWKELKKPIMALAPMANVTDAAFRFVIARYGKPDVMFTEFVSADGLVSAGREVLLLDLKFDESERPVVAQFFGATPEHFYRVALLAQELGFDGIDVNMGCPDRAVLKQGAGAALIEEPELAKKIISETKRGAGSLPVSVKTRLGLKKNILKSWLPHLLEMDLAAVTVHGRTAKELSLVPADWEAIGEAAEIRSKYSSDTLVLGNGDVKDLADAEAKAKNYGLDGIMVGRGVFGNPWFFNREKQGEISREEKLKVMLEHTRLFEKIFKGRKNFDVMKKHYKAYVNGFRGAKELRTELMSAKNADEVRKVLRRHDF